MSKVKNNRELILYPQISKRDDLVEICSKLSWYVPIRKEISLIFKIKFLTEKDLVIRKNEIPKWMNNIVLNLENIIFINDHFLGNLKYYYKFLKSFFCKFIFRNNRVIIVIWDKKKVSFIFQLIKKFLKVRVIDNKICNIFPIGTHFIWHIFNAIFLFYLLKFLYSCSNGSSPKKPSQAYSKK